MSVTPTQQSFPLSVDENQQLIHLKYFLWNIDVDENSSSHLSSSSSSSSISSSTDVTLPPPPPAAASTTTTTIGTGVFPICIALSSLYTSQLFHAILLRRALTFQTTFFPTHNTSSNKTLKHKTTCVTAEEEEEEDEEGMILEAEEELFDLSVYNFSSYLLQILEFEMIDWSSILSTSSISSCYPVRKGLIRKSTLSFLLKKYAAKRPQSILHKSVPEALVVEIYDPEYLEEALNEIYEVRDMIPGEDVWIMKASMINQASGIHIITCVEDVEEVLQRQEVQDIREWIFQRYIKHPLLHEGRKFHCRVYVLCVGNLYVYVWDRILALIASNPYSLDTLRSDRYAHITNTCANQSNPEFSEEKYVKLLSEILSESDFNQAFSNIQAVTHEIFAAMHHDPTFFLPVPNAFELFGFDFLLDENLNVWFLEANAGPDFAMTGHRLQNIITGLIEQTTRLTLDPLAQSLQKQISQQTQAGAEAQTEKKKEKAVLGDWKSFNLAIHPPPLSQVNFTKEEMSTLDATGAFQLCYQHVNEKAAPSMSFY